MLKSVLLVGIGSFFGGALRYAVSLLVKSGCASSFPWATLAVNLIGCFLIGVVCALFSRSGAVSQNIFLLLATGFCGGFTTFSAFANEGLLMLQEWNIASFLLYAVGSIVIGVALVALGYWIVELLV
jgi:CrcB protein